MNPVAALGDGWMQPGPSVPLLSRFEQFKLSPELQKNLEIIERGGTPDIEIGQLMAQFALTMQQFQRGITTGTSNLPIRENLEAEAKLLVPVETPFRNRLARTPGAGTASQWRTITSTGGGWGTSLDQPGGVGLSQIFFGESGRPAELATVYGARTAGYKLLGQMGKTTGFAQAAGATFQSNFAMERTNALRNAMLNEENALINGDSASVIAPWGDGTNALAFDGLINRITVANGTPSAQVQTGVGGLTFAHMDAQLRRLWNQGAQGVWMMVNGQEALSMKNLAQASGSIHRIVVKDTGDSTVGLAVTGYVHPISGEVVPVLVNRFMPAGTMIFGCDRLPDGSPAADVSVLPQVQLPELAPNDVVQGYVAQEIAPSWESPLVYGFIVSVFEVLRIKSQNHFAKSVGVTAV